METTSESPAAAPRLILASQSPRRQSLLRHAGFEFDVDPANIDEESYPTELLPSDVALLLAKRKAESVSQKHPNDVVLAADTVVALGDSVLGKPKDAADARRMLRLLAGTTHIVITGVAVMHASASFERVKRVMSAVRMRLLNSNEIDRYVETGDWEGKAGGYGIQDHDPFVKRMSGCHTNIVGLPMTTTKVLLAGAGIYPRAKPE
jgi:septum formation protein